MFLDKLFKTTSVVAKIGVKAGINIGKACVNTAQDAVKAGSAVANKDTEALGKIVENRLNCACKGVIGTFESATYVANKAIDCVDKGKTFLDKETEEHLARLTSAVALGAASFLIIDSDDAPSDYENIDESGLVSNVQLTGIENGVFIGDFSDFETLTKAGEIEGSEHIESNDYVRSLEARDLFLKEHGFSSIPQGYEVHHIIPLSEGGADVSENMVLIKDELHSLITKAHAEYYGWHNS